jgi:glycosyltransferase involved in cell wall biosynthesis
MTKILILYTKAPQEVFNRKSALGSYINCLANLLETSEIDVYLNGSRLTEMEESNSNNSMQNSNSLRRMIPGVMKRFFRERKMFQTSNQVINEILAQDVEYDHVLEFYTLGSIAGLTISKSMNCDYSIIYDGPIIEEYEFFNEKRPLLERKILHKEKTSLKHAKNVVVYSQPMKEYVREISSTKASIQIHQNVDFTRFESFSDRDFNKVDIINICFIGSFLKWHQVDMLVNSISQLVAEGRNIHLYLIGDGQLKSEIEAMVETSEISKHVTFTGFLDGEELYQLKKKMHIGVMPGSNWYGAPNKIFEYGAMKMAAVVPKTPTIEDLFDSTEVQFYEWKNQEDLTLNLAKLIDENLIEKKANSLFLKIQKNNTESRTRAFYSNLLGTKINSNTPISS